MHLVLFKHLVVDFVGIIFRKGLVQFENGFIEGNFLFELDGDDEGVFSEIVLD